MTKYYVYYLESEFARLRAVFDNKAETIKCVKSELEGTDGSFALQIIGFNDGTPVYAKTYTAENYKAKAI